MATPTQTTSARLADNVGSNPTIAAGLTFQAGRDVVIQLGHFGDGNFISAISIGGVSGSPIAIRQYSSGVVRAESWLFKNLGSNDSNIAFTLSGSGHYITLVGREFPAGTFGTIDAAAAGGNEGSAQAMAMSTAASIANASSALFATFVSQTGANPVGFISISGYSDVVAQQDNVNSQSIFCGWLEETTTGTKTANATQTSNFPWAGSLGVVQINAGDVTAPVLTSATSSNVRSSTATIGATTDEANGTMYAVVDTVTTTPSTAELEAGQDGDGGSATWSGSQAISSTGAKTFNVTGLTPNTEYTYFIGHKDAAGNFSNIVSGTFSTFQRAAPTSTVTAGAWEPSTGASLPAMLDEQSPDDGDYIATQTPGDYCEFAISVLIDPATGTNHLPAYRIWGNGTSGMEVTVKQGATVIATFTHDPAPTTPTTYNQTLSGTEADSITDYSDIRMGFREI